MIILRAAKKEDQEKLDKEITRFEKKFRMIENDNENERAAAATSMVKSLETINLLMGKGKGHSGAFGLHSLLEGTGTTVDELRKAKELIEQYEAENTYKANVIEEMKRHNVYLKDELNEIKARNEAVIAALAKGGGLVGKEFVTATLGISVLLGLVASTVYDELSWISASLIAAAIIASVATGFHFLGGLFLKISNEATYRIGLCAEPSLAGLKAVGFAFVTLFFCGIAAQAIGMESFLGEPLPSQLSIEGVALWFSSVWSGIFGIIVLILGMGLYFLLRNALRDRSLPPFIEVIFS